LDFIFVTPVCSTKGPACANKLEVDLAEIYASGLGPEYAAPPQSIWCLIQAQPLHFLKVRKSNVYNLY